MNNISEESALFQLVLNHADFVIINKASGVSVHRDNQDIGLVDHVAQTLGYSKLYLVHRLDKMTSGLLILAKSVESNRLLSQMFEKREVSKYYIALSDQKPKKKQGLIKGDMEKSRGGSWKLVKTHFNPAVTQFFTYSLSDEVSKGLRLFLLKPHTGKTHQLRVAMKSVGATILGDLRYGKADDVKKVDRGYLHAWSLRFKYDEEIISVNALPNTGRLFLHDGLIDTLIGLGEPSKLPWPTL